MRLHSRYSLIKRILELKKLPASAFSLAGDNLLPYEEKSAGYTQPVDDKNSIDIPAHDLFNLYTADIIKKEAIFVR